MPDWRPEAHLGSKNRREAAPSQLVIAETRVEVAGETEEVVCFLCFSDTSRRKERGKSAGLHQVLPTRHPVMLAIAPVTFVQAITEGDTHQTTTRVSETHSPVRVERGHAGEFLIGEVSTDPRPHDLLRFPEFSLKVHSDLPNCGREPCLDASVF
jgi:hypothetical protein